ncbi:hypothetical protein MCOR14_003368 [Pyricularia oryzae]|nr:hypothetical protein MCOR11_009377 [Pyricularia oryzae]KAI6537189.1 hypothetical protein MCOR10_001775 [Pyricularia oryzae]KAI6553733.1 hypothetical protein MCOR09_010508 [Pyricularia oryzae]KAI6633197.1 hypothetical protein MCOR08_005159 [Pyricularia oryzae]KAI6640568.1 hypothetical protein MCOR14_003368 [Pyricularia oryzae]
MRPTTLVLPLAVLAGSVTARLTRPEGRGLQSREAPQDITPNRDSGAYRSVAYVTNWSIYGAKFLPEQIAVDSISHVQYAFADILANGTVVSSDAWADTQKQFGNGTQGGNSSDAHGLVEQLYKIKQANRNVKMLLSIGGYTWSPKFVPVAADAGKRAAFVSSAVALMGDWGMDGLDVDWEYPDTAETNKNCVLLLQELRRGLDDYSQQHTGGRYKFSLSMPAPAGPTHYAAFDFKAMDASLDFWSIMAFDFAGSWDNTTGHQANVYPGPDLTTKASIDVAVSDYVKAGVAAGKINLGLPLYGRSFDKTTGLGRAYTASTAGSLEGQAGIWIYKDLPRAGATVLYDDVAKASYTMDNSTGQLISYDDLRSVQFKSYYVKQKQIGGVMFWESSQDRPGSDSIVRTMARSLGKLESAQNWLSYPGSQYANIKNNMGQAV